MSNFFNYIYLKNQIKYQILGIVLIRTNQPYLLIGNNLPMII